MKNVLVYGYSRKGNLGDELFIPAFQKLFPNFNLKFVNKLTKADINNVDAVFIGGGSLLNDPLVTDEDITQTLRAKPLYYIGVGCENIHSSHIYLMRTANLIAIRSDNNIEAVKLLSSKVIQIPDLVYALKEDALITKPFPKSVLILPNVETIGRNQDAQWKHSAWNYFKSEFSQFLDVLRKDWGYEVHYGSMCENPRQSDRAACGEIINQMVYRNYHQILPEFISSFKTITSLFSSYEAIYTQRYHGAILADICQVPFVSIAHHDKLKEVNGYVLPYYEASKVRLLKSFDEMKNVSKKAINSDSFEDLKSIVNKQLG